MTHAEQRPRVGFTLVELLVVIGIIGVLLALLLPVLHKVRMESDRAVCMAHIRELGNAVLFYCHDNHGYFPTPAEPAEPKGVPWVPFIYMPSDWVHWQKDRNLTDSALARYLASGRDAETFTRLLRCPADHFEDRLEFPLGFYAPGQGPYLYSYALSSYVAENRPEGSWATKISMWRATPKKVLMSECTDMGPKRGTSNIRAYYAGPAWDIVFFISRRHGTVKFGGDISGNPFLRRGVLIGTKASTFFMDGHVAPIEAEYSLDDRQIQLHPWDE